MRWAALMSFVASLMTGFSAGAEDKTAVAAAAETKRRADAYTVCAACHLPAGQGIPGAFPPIRNRARDIALLDGGREYLIGAVWYGLIGQISAGGQSYFGAMAGQRGAMDSGAVADALNHLVFSLVDDQVGAELTPFSAEEVSAVAEQWADGGPSTMAKFRQDLVNKHADDWPG